jgi:hypothetical protein
VVSLPPQPSICRCHQFMGRSFVSDLLVLYKDMMEERTRGSVNVRSAACRFFSFSIFILSGRGRYHRGNYSESLFADAASLKRSSTFARPRLLGLTSLA